MTGRDYREEARSTTCDVHNTVLHLLLLHNMKCQVCMLGYWYNSVLHQSAVHVACSFGYAFEQASGNGGQSSFIALC
jgi:hypothetical protein